MQTPAPPLDWLLIDTVLLDMDGTLLDLRFDNWFWQEHLPHLWAAREGMTLPAALQVLTPRFEAARGTLEWYCIDFWSRELNMDVRAIKHAVRENVAWIPGAEAVLRHLRGLGKRLVLVTNAHPETLAIKDLRVDLVGHLDAVFSSHAFGAPKEAAAFWPAFAQAEPFDPQRTLFVDDSLSVLLAARAYGIGWLRAVRRPDSGHPANAVGDFPGIETVADLLR
ncbi:MAG: GMP/IMP nucleotidase [Pseudomonadota bacterium]